MRNSVGVLAILGVSMFTSCLFTLTENGKKAFCQTVVLLKLLNTNGFRYHSDREAWCVEENLMKYDLVLFQLSLSAFIGAG